MRATNLMFRCPKEQTPDPYSYTVIKYYLQSFRLSIAVDQYHN